MAVAAPARLVETLDRARIRTLFVLWTTYGSFYLCRTNFGPAVPSLRHDLGLKALQIGFLLGAVKLGYALGQLVNGQLTERFGPRRVLITGMIGSSVATLLLAAAPSLAALPGAAGAPARGVGVAVSALAGVFGLSVDAGGPLALMLLLAFLNGWFQAGGWPPCVKIAGRWFPVALRGRTMGVLGTSLTLGSALAIFVVGALLFVTGKGWRVAFVVPPLLLLASCLHTALRLRESPPEQSGGEAAAAARPAADRLPISQALAATLGNPRIWVLALALFGVDAVRYGFLDWAPGHLTEVHHSGAASAALKTAVFPLAGAFGAISSGWMTDRFFESRRAPVCSMMLAAVALLTLAYRGAVWLGTGPTVLCLGLTGYFLYGAQILLVGTAAQDYARRGATAAAAGFVDFAGHVGAFSGDVITALMLKRHGWGGAIAWWACAAFGAAAVVAMLWRVRAGDDTTKLATVLP
jgi:MFS transporter, OPA family, glycerol-3-phosphate transporter